MHSSCCLTQTTQLEAFGPTEPDDDGRDDDTYEDIEKKAVSTSLSPTPTCLCAAI